jgi:hypothetical protein
MRLRDDVIKQSQTSQKPPCPVVTAPHEHRGNYRQQPDEYKQGTKVNAAMRQGI